MNLRFTNTKNPSKELLNQIEILLTDSFTDLRVVKDTLNYFNSRSPIDLFLLTDDGQKVVAMACGLQSEIKIQVNPKVHIKGISLGSICVDKSLRGKGLGSFLMDQLSLFCQSHSIDMMFLQGIYGFYERFGFESILKQSKIVVDLRRFNSELAPSVREANYRDLEDLSKTHHEMISKMLFCSDRSEQLWEFLILQGRYTRLFYSPRIVSTDSTDAYFTIDEIEPYRIREHAFGLRPNAAESLIASLKQYQIENKLDFLEIMSSRESELVALLSQKCSLVITEYLKVNEGFLARIVNHKALFGRDEVLQVFQKKISSCVGKEAALTSDGESLKILDIDGKTLSVVDGTLLMGVLFGRFNFDINLRTPRSSAYTGGMNPQSFCLQAESL